MCNFMHTTILGYLFLLPAEMDSNFLKVLMKSSELGEKTAHSDIF